MNIGEGGDGMMRTDGVQNGGDETERHFDNAIAVEGGVH